MRTILAKSNNYTLYGVYEEAQLEGLGIDGHVVVGAFYGSADCGCIDRNEKWCISAGNGLVIYSLEAPYQSYKFDTKTTQWRELWRGIKDSGWYPEIIYQIEDNEVRIVIDIFSNAKGVYDLKIETLEVTKRV